MKPDFESALMARLKQLYKLEKFSEKQIEHFKRIHTPEVKAMMNTEKGKK